MIVGLEREGKIAVREVWPPQLLPQPRLLCQGFQLACLEGPAESQPHAHHITSTKHTRMP